MPIISEEQPCIFPPPVSSADLGKRPKNGPFADVLNEQPWREVAYAETYATTAQPAIQGEAGMEDASSSFTDSFQYPFSKPTVEMGDNFGFDLATWLDTPQHRRVFPQLCFLN